MSTTSSRSPKLAGEDTAVRSSGGSGRRPVAPTSITCICWPSPARRPCRCTDGSGSRRSGTSPAPSARDERLGAAVVRLEPGFVQVQVPEQPIDEEGRARLVALSGVGEAHLAHAEQHGTCGPALGQSKVRASMSGSMAALIDRRCGARLNGERTKAKPCAKAVSGRKTVRLQANAAGDSSGTNLLDLQDR